MTRSVVRRVARWMVGVVLLAQMSIAAYACPGIASALQRIPQATAVGSMPMAEPADTAAVPVSAPAPPCDDMTGAMDPAAPNLCAEHCRYGQQSDQASTVNVPVAAALVALYATPVVREPVPPPRPAAALTSALVAASPPRAILHCVFRI